MGSSLRSCHCASPGRTGGMAPRFYHGAGIASGENAGCPGGWSCAVRGGAAALGRSGYRTTPAMGGRRFPGGVFDPDQHRPPERATACEPAPRCRHAWRLPPKAVADPPRGGRHPMKALALRTAVAALVFTAVPSHAQQITGTPGSPSATTTIDGQYLPAAAAEVRRRRSTSTPSSPSPGGRRRSCRPRARRTCC